MTAAVAIGAFGLLIGSFLNVVVYRVPAGKSIVSPPSACGNCGHEVRGYDNIPILSWLILRGKCRDCASPISTRYPLVELAGGLAFAAVALFFVPPIIVAGSTPNTVAAIIVLVAFLYLAAISIALVLIDIDVRRLPNSIVLPAYAVGAVLFTVAAVLTGDFGPLLTSAIGSIALGGIYLALAFFVPGGMGLGDVKLAGALGLFLGWLGWGPLAVGAIFAFLLGGVFGIILIAVRKGGRKTAIPFGPWMVAGAWVGIFAGTPIAAGYLSLFGLA